MYFSQVKTKHTELTATFVTLGLTVQTQLMKRFGGLQLIKC